MNYIITNVLCHDGERKVSHGLLHNWYRPNSLSFPLLHLAPWATLVVRYVDMQGDDDDDADRVSAQVNTITTIDSSSSKCHNLTQVYIAAGGIASRLT